MDSNLNMAERTSSTAESRVPGKGFCARFCGEKKHEDAHGLGTLDRSGQRVKEWTQNG